ncbi:predicted protein [Coccidioides posadasii str. Silveira]|uniref:Predicted protein n=2 Tax=Coccidioides posadasii TaxID=199306 RepID=E9CYJ4_COCPS|nr:predicted protein [Coccidioides posadasii str. Silveira]KMM66764.1 hypothetical protein CPAG_03102 [Coccidioides posadasii RMSCC 3488]
MTRDSRQKRSKDAEELIRYSTRPSPQHSCFNDRPLWQARVTGVHGRESSMRKIAQRRHDSVSHNSDTVVSFLATIFRWVVDYFEVTQSIRFVDDPTGYRLKAKDLIIKLQGRTCKFSLDISDCTQVYRACYLIHTGLALSLSMPSPSRASRPGNKYRRCP